MQVWLMSQRLTSAQGHGTSGGFEGLHLIQHGRGQ